MYKKYNFIDYIRVTYTFKNRHKCSDVPMNNCGMSWHHYPTRLFTVTYIEVKLFHQFEPFNLSYPSSYCLFID